MTHYQLVVFSNPVEGKESEYNEWYSEQHLADVLRVPGFVAAQRFVIADESEAPRHRYLALYEIETDDLAATMKELRSRSRTPAMELSDAMDLNGTQLSTFRAITPRLRASTK